MRRERIERIKALDYGGGMDSNRLFHKYQRKKEKYVRRLEKVWEEQLSPKEALALAKACSDILDSVIDMAQGLEQVGSPNPTKDYTLDNLSDEELERYLESSKNALLKESGRDPETAGQG